MKRLAGLLVLVGVLTGCGVTPQPTEAPPTQTPWIIVVTATPGPEGLAEAGPTQTPWIIIATPTRSRTATQVPIGRPTDGPEETAEPAPTTDQVAPTAVSPGPTGTPAPESFEYPPPVLMDPPDGRPVGWKGTITLAWRGVGVLARDEYYHVHLDRPPKTEGEQWYGDYIYTKDTTLLVEQSFLAPFHLAAEHGSAVVYWWVRVVRKTGEDANRKPLGVDISPPSQKRFFVVEPRPGD